MKNTELVTNDLLKAIVNTPAFNKKFVLENSANEDREFFAFDIRKFRLFFIFFLFFY